MICSIRPLIKQILQISYDLNFFEYLVAMEINYLNQGIKTSDDDRKDASLFSRLVIGHESIKSTTIRLDFATRTLQDVDVLAVLDL